MVTFSAEIEKFDKKGEKSGWTYILISQIIAQQLKPECRTSFRVRGTLDVTHIRGLALVPMGGGDFILALKTALRKQIGKDHGAKVQVTLQEDLEFTVETPEEMRVCLEEEDHLMRNFTCLSKSHQRYFINWFNSAKTEKTKVKRLTMFVEAMDKRLAFGEMIRAEKLRS